MGLNFFLGLILTSHSVVFVAARISLTSISSPQCSYMIFIYFQSGHFTVVYLVAKPLIWSEAEGDLVVIETSILWV